MMKVGDTLRKARQEKYLEYDDIAKELKIQPRYLRALETGDYSVFSSAVHLKGFLRNYARYLGLDDKTVLAFFRREYDELKSRKEIKNVTKPIDTPRIVLTPAVLVSVLVSFMVVAFFGYLFYEFRQFAGAPLLVVQQPRQDKMTISNDVLNIVGKTDPDATLSINGQRISLGEEGVFSTSITLSEGVNILNIVSVNKLGKESKQTKTIVVEKEVSPEKAEPPPKEADKEGINLEIRIGPNAAWIEVIVDGEKLHEGLLSAGVSKKFRALEGLKVITGNAGSTQLILNDEDKGKMGEDGEVKEAVFGKNFEEESSPSAEPQTP